VAEYLAEPRHVVAANHEGPIVASSEGPLVSGAWFVLAFDHLRARVEYITYEPPTRIDVAVTISGRGSAGTRSLQEFALTEIAVGRGTRIDAAFEGEGGWLRWTPLARAMQSIAWRRLRTNLEQSA
jgi:hypothetical protein